MKSKTITEVLNKLIGEIEPIGDSREDAESYINLCVAIQVCETLVSDIASVSTNVSCSEGSRQKCGEKALKFINDLYGELSEYKEE